MRFKNNFRKEFSAMENILKILKDFGVEIPQEKEKDFEKKVLENYKTISEVEKLQGKLTDAEEKAKTLQEQYDTDIAKRDTDLKELQKKLKAGEGNAETLKDLQEKLSTLQTTYDTEKSEYQQKLAEQEYSFLVKEAANNLKFSSNSAKKQFIQDVTEKKLSVENGALLGFNDFVEQYKTADAGAFLAEEQPKDEPPAPKFASKSGQPTEPEAEPFVMPKLL